ncbi:MAG TPA: hypothetical protein VFT74_21635, partial [Isosphaeraceae bacterium]|nr:hypothetical protein [Isosphaeraceae bacterium]
WNLVRDPFQNRQEDAYIHFHKDLHYQLTFVNNRASDPISVTYHRVLVSQGAGEKNETELDRKPITLTIKPGGKIEVPGLTLSWTAFPSPEENQIKPRDLEVRATVSVDGGEPLEVPPLRLRLHQIHLRDYMTFETEVGPNSRGVRSWIVHGERSFQDPVTEPILLSEISAYIGGTLIEDKKGASILVNPHLEAPRNTLDFHVPVTGFEPGGKVKWSAKIENEKVEGEISSH